MCFPRQRECILYRVGFMATDSEIEAQCSQLKSSRSSRHDSIPFLLHLLCLVLLENMHVVRNSDNYSLFLFQGKHLLGCDFCNKRDIDVSAEPFFNIIEPTDTSETTVLTYITERRPNPQYAYLNSHCCENRNSHVILFVYRCH
jgi:hypothetical protein